MRGDEKADQRTRPRFLFSVERLRAVAFKGESHRFLERRHRVSSTDETCPSRGRSDSPIEERTSDFARISKRRERLNLNLRITFILFNPFRKTIDRSCKRNLREIIKISRKVKISEIFVQNKRFFFFQYYYPSISFCVNTLV